VPKIRDKDLSLSSEPSILFSGGNNNGGGKQTAVSPDTLCLGAQHGSEFLDSLAAAGDGIEAVCKLSAVSYQPKTKKLKADC
jgi:hypothetical protein